MTLYAGETTRITSTAEDFDGTPLTDANVSSATVTIYKKSDNSIILPTANMVYSDDDAQWFYDWDTDAVSSGTYLAKVRLVGATFDTWEFKRFRLSTNPV
jgi:hypothetical protein